MSSTISLNALNAMPAADFTARLGAIFEHSPWVAERAAAKRPFASVDALHRAMADAVRDATEEERLRLIRAHPELAGKAAVRGELTDESTRVERLVTRHVAAGRSPDASASQSSGWPSASCIQLAAWTS